MVEDSSESFEADAQPLGNITLRKSRLNLVCMRELAADGRSTRREMFSMKPKQANVHFSLQFLAILQDTHTNLLSKAD